MTTTSAALCRGLHEPLVVEDVELEAPHAGEVRVRLGASGVCHSDLSIVNGTLFGGGFPIVLGHEGAGVVEAVGDGVTTVAPGDHVVISWVPQCGECFFCEHDQGYLCERGSAATGVGGLLDGTPRFAAGGEVVRQMACSGTFAEATVVPEVGVVPIPDDVPFDVAALIGCGVLTGVGAATSTASIRRGDTVAVVGCGGVGLNVVQGARIAGAERIIAVDRVASKLALATSLGATDVVDASDGGAVSQVRALTGGRGADVAFEVIGLKATIQEALSMTRRGGECVLVGVPPLDVTVELPAFVGVVLASKTIRGCWYGSSNVRRDVPKLLDWYRAGQLRLDELVSRRIALADVNDAFRAMEAGEVARSVIVYGDR